MCSGDSAHAPSTSTPLTQIVQAGDVVTLTSSPNPSVSGQPVTFTVTVASTGGAARGTITFLDGTAAFGTASLTGSGQATFTTSTLAAGTRSITAAYGGDATHAASTSAALAQVVLLPSTTTLIASPNPAAVGQLVTLTAAVTGSGSTPTGSITFTDGTATLGSASLDGSGHAVFTTSSLTAGSHSLAAAYAGSAIYAASTSGAITQIVSAEPTIPTLSREMLMLLAAMLSIAGCLRARKSA